ncbi:hypothetical protein J2W30_003236 [Variovorax boronicumulans]|uniref:hypothetical protein n=1 Tax=Variovorax boronicumulans TaxID=436515 RepID=UPI00278901EE|nr:hypothetical protein [Variovorax boronicumulans]MDQ0035468.1 hypothetical protein [Variovorax boronicumulans]
MTTSFIACSFSAGLDDLTRKQQADPIAVLRVLKAAGRFSSFEASANDVIARTITRMIHKGLTTIKDGVRTNHGKLIEVDDAPYPWTNVKLTAAGEALLAAASIGSEREEAGK